WPPRRSHSHASSCPLLLVPRDGARHVQSGRLVRTKRLTVWALHPQVEGLEKGRRKCCRHRRRSRKTIPMAPLPRTLPVPVSACPFLPRRIATERHPGIATPVSGVDLKLTVDRQRGVGKPFFLR